MSSFLAAMFIFLFYFGGSSSAEEAKSHSRPPAKSEAASNDESSIKKTGSGEFSQRAIDPKLIINRIRTTNLKGDIGGE